MYKKIQKKQFHISSLLYILALAPLPTLAQWSGTGTGNYGYDNAAKAALPSASLYNIISATLGWLLAILGFIAIAGFVISGLQYLLAAGDEGLIDRAKNSMKYSVIGVIVALSGFVLITAIDSWLNASTSF